MAQVEKSEKITINIGLIDLGQIDLLVNEGFYANRTDFIRTAIRRQLETRSGAVDQTVARRTITLGTQHYSRRDLEELRAAVVLSNSASWGSRRSTKTSARARAGDDHIGGSPRGLSRTGKLSRRPWPRELCRRRSGAVAPSTRKENLIMNDDRNATMADALRLTRDGQLMEATALLQQSLGGAGRASASAAGARAGCRGNYPLEPPFKLTLSLPPRTARQLTPGPGSGLA